MWQIGIKDICDILLVASLLYYLYRKTKENGTIVIFQGIVSVIVLWVVVSQVFRMRLMGALLDQVISVSMIIIVVLFQNGIREALIRMGSRRQWTSMLRFFGREELLRNDNDMKWVDAVVLACQHMSEEKVGALIVVERVDKVEPLLYTPGLVVDAVVSSRLIEQVFYKNSPLHDGAMLISNGRIAQAAANLPLSKNRRLPAELGTRHRSAVGISEECDCLVVVVSEETGGISICQNGKIARDLTLGRLQKRLLDKSK